MKSQLPKKQRKQHVQRKQASEKEKLTNVITHECQKRERNTIKKKDVIKKQQRRKESSKKKANLNKQNGQKSLRFEKNQAIFHDQIKN